MRMIDTRLAACAPGGTATGVSRLIGWTAGLTLFLLTAHAPATQVTLTWDAPSSATVDGYRLYYGVQSNIYSASLDVGIATAYTVTGLTSGQTYYFTVTAYDIITGVESAFADELSTTLPPSAGSASRSVITLEAESMALMGYVWESNADASGGAVISRHGPVGSPPGVALAAFPGPVGTYEITVSYFDENDGQSTLALTVNGQVVDAWVAQADLPSSSPDAVTLTYRVVTTRDGPCPWRYHYPGRQRAVE